ncbi:MAG TPA: type II toxin-antitoxin system VapC family toxin [Allosphingosinicella sp.]|jgi:PIN domain nuclease of toxin-antitoxin system|uniref:type II toxin-antitoxin system VapC family toxin n=1 Tax=Allosphingosinicella sp. TaxID=2823234 RepID=UPI002F29E476
MRLLLDTHALIWAAQEPELLSEKARVGIETGENVIFVSAASAFEIATKYRLGNLKVSPSLAENFVVEVERCGFAILPISAEHGQRAGLLAIKHKDPWDRMLIAQAQIAGMRLVSNEALFDDFAVSRYW